MCSKTYKIIAIFAINCSTFHENLSMSHCYYCYVGSFIVELGVRKREGLAAARSRLMRASVPPPSSVQKRGGRRNVPEEEMQKLRFCKSPEHSKDGRRERRIIYPTPHGSSAPRATECKSVHVTRPQPRRRRPRRLATR